MVDCFEFVISCDHRQQFVVRCVLHPNGEGGGGSSISNLLFWNTVMLICLHRFVVHDSRERAYWLIDIDNSKKDVNDNQPNTKYESNRLAYLRISPFVSLIWIDICQAISSYFIAASFHLGIQYWVLLRIVKIYWNSGCKWEWVFIFLQRKIAQKIVTVWCLQLIE